VINENMETDYERRIRETRARTLAQNQEEYKSRCDSGLPVGVLEMVILEQIRNGEGQLETGYQAGAH
jgi:hypothetical protein